MVNMMATIPPSKPFAFQATTTLATLKSSRNSNGFTLIELTLVIVIIGILSVVVVPKFASVNVFSQRTYFDEVLSSIRYAQKIAVGMGCEVRVSITSSSLTLNLRANCRSGNFTQGVRDPANFSSTFTKFAPTGIALASGSLPIYFDRLGRAHNSGGAIANASLTVGSRTIQIIGETGYTYEP